MKALRKIMDKILSYSLSILFVVMTGLVLWQVFTRYILGDPSIFTEELVRIILLWTSFVGAAYAFGKREHMALVFLKNGAKGSLHVFIAVAIDVIIIIFTAVILVYGGYIATKNVIDIKTPILDISKGWMYSPFFVAGIITLIYQVMNIVEDFKINKTAE
ncbi:TRAP transporter small permease [Vallitaleaceae bacterium 9-2]